MQDYAGKVAVITGAASGVGLGLARTFVRAGMSVAMCDIRDEPLQAAVKETTTLGQGRVIGIVADVSQADSVERAADQVEKEFGKIHVVMNNAGVVIRGLKMEEITDNAWDWLLGVNLYGVIHGIRSFVPRIRAHGEGGHIVNTASVAGFQVGNRGTGAYATSKFAVVALSEVLAKDLAGTNIKVSVLAPAAVDTDLYTSSAEHRGTHSIDLPNPYAEKPADIAAGIHPDEAGRRVLAGMRAGQFYLFTHPEARAWVQERFRQIMDGFDFAEEWQRENVKR